MGKKFQNIVADSEMKRIVFEGLISFSSICEKNNLHYYLAFGTLLGAVRHKGFIPWDDDIDLLVPREDYEKLRNNLIDVETDEWELLSYSKEPKFLMPFMKYCNKKTSVVPSRFNTDFIYGLSIDIFPLDFFNGEAEIDVRNFIKTMYESLVDLERKSFKTAVYKTGTLCSLKRKIKKLVYLLSYKKTEDLLSEYKNIDQTLTRLSKEGTLYSALMYNPYNTVWEKKDFCGEHEQYKELEFEGHKFIVPYNYDSVLRKHYGDYMKLPPVNERVRKHSFTAYYNF